MARLVTAALNLLVASAPLRALDSENIRFLVSSGMTIDATVIATVIERWQDRDLDLLEEVDSMQAILDTVNEAAAVVNERNQRELPNLYDSPGFPHSAVYPQAPSTHGSQRTLANAPSTHQLNDLESALVVSLYEECRRRDPRNSDHAARCLALARAQPRPLELSHLIRDVAVSDAGRSLDWHLLYTSFADHLSHQDGPEAWQTAVRAATPRQRSASTPHYTATVNRNERRYDEKAS